jgi:zinc-finger of acetyl-transferase ESCO
MSNILIQKGAGIVECRICGFMFMPNEDEDRERHEQVHRQIIFGGLPYDVREFIKRAAWDVLRGDEVWDEQTRERAKRALVFAWWMRAVANGIPENDFQTYMEAQFEQLDAELDDDQEALHRSEGKMKRWQQYGG